MDPNIFQDNPYGLDKDSKSAFLVKELNALNRHHFANCLYFKQILTAFNQGKDLRDHSSPNDFFSLPVRLFKELSFRSVSEKEIFKTITSSGTTSQTPSRIYLDKTTSINQTKALSAIIKNFIGPKRLPMIIIDSESVLKDKKTFSARGGGILGMSNFGRHHFYLLDENMDINLPALKEFLAAHKDQKILLFGFTFMIWDFFYKKLRALGERLDIKRSILIHSGGWKKLANQAVSNEIFKDRIHTQTGIDNIYNFYGMAEQLGSIFMECERGHLHASIFSDIIIRNPFDWSPRGINEEGIIEVLSILPISYPGHVLLTEDTGILLGEDDCPCGRKGKYFKVIGRVAKSESRGCSDTYEEH